MSGSHRRKHGYIHIPDCVRAWSWENDTPEADDIGPEDAASPPGEDPTPIYSDELRTRPASWLSGIPRKINA